MSSALSKRQQARNEKILQDLVHNVPGNNFCADCHAGNPAWASWSLGIFLCMRCATIHRKLGTHVSKVKSLSMDSWTNEQVDNMRKVGNVVSNKLYNPENKKPPVPVDADEADSAMERFIRQKYVSRTLSTNRRHKTGGSDSDETRPPLPPKTPSRFGLRSASSLFPLGSRAKKASSGQEPTSPRDARQHPPPRSRSPQAFGASIEHDRTDGQDTERKLAKLRDMGFRDDQRNAMVLKGVGGNLEKAVEALIRLGEGDGRPPTLLTPARSSTMPVPRTLTPATSAAPGSEAPRARPISPASTNPFDMLDTPPPPQPLSSQSTGTLQSKNPYLSTNPFGAPQQTPSALDLAFQNMSLAPPSQPLFPHHTGGLAQQQNPQPPYQQPMAVPLTAPLPSSTQSYPAMGINGNHTYPPPGQPTMASYNPFFQAQPPQQPLSINTAQFSGNLGNNPFTRSPTRMQSPTLTQIPEQAQQNFYAPAAQPQTNNPFFTQTTQTAQQLPGQMHIPQQMGLTAQITGYVPQQQRPDKASILALYNYPQLAPNPSPFQSQDSGQAAPAQTPSSVSPSQTLLQAEQQQQQQQQQQHQPVSIAAGSKNPFVGAGTGRNGLSTGSVQPGRLTEATPKHNVSRESMMAVGLEWSNGRHSPDAFASLSARDTR
ncbi:hypothetical protein VTK56DRAFT_7830 [Thermocarpiscus australiensis]